MEAITNQVSALAEPITTEQDASGLTTRIGDALRNGYEAVKDRATTLAVIGGIAFVGAQAAELSVNVAPVGAEENVPSTTAPVDSATKQECIDVALAKPKIVKALVLNAGRFDNEPTQSFYLSTRYKRSMPEACKGLYAQGNQARSQAFHNGHWVNMGYWHNVSIIPETGSGNWEDIGNVMELKFPVCSGRILLKANITDLSVDTGIPWKPHQAIAKRIFKPISTRILPHKPKAC